MGDYLVHKRFFALPTKLSNVFGYAFIGGGMLMFLFEDHHLVAPLTAVMLAAGFSLWQMIQKRITALQQSSAIS